MSRYKMKIFLMFLISLLPVSAEPPESAISQALKESKIAKLELNKNTFEEAMAMVKNEWKKQHPQLDFPVAIAEFERDRGHPPLITLSLREVPFIKALQFIGQTSNRRLLGKPDLLTLEEVGLIVEDWITKSHKAPDELLTALGLGKQPTEEDLRQAYARYGVHLLDWMKIGYHDEYIIVRAFKKQQQQIAGINLLLSQGFTISKDE